MDKVTLTIRSPDSHAETNIRNRETVTTEVENVKPIGGTTDYEHLRNKPSLNGVEISGKHDSAYYGITSFWFGTRTEYNALPVVLPDVCYCLREGS